MLDSALLYTGLVAAFAGLLGMIRPRTRKGGAILALVGLIIAILALALPVTEKRTASRTTLLDGAMPVWQFDERHELVVNASPEHVFEAIQKVTANEIFLFRTLTTIRRFGRPGPESILNAPEKQPLLDVATHTSFVVVAAAPPGELVLGTVVAAPREARATGRLTRDLFYRKLRPGVALAAMNFRIVPEGPGRSRVTTETRVFANTPQTVRQFAVYWRVIHPGSDIIRRMWLRAIKRRAES